MLTLARRPFQLIKKGKANWENASSDDALGTSERKRKLDVAQRNPDLRVQYPSQEEIIKNVVLSKKNMDLVAKSDRNYHLLPMQFAHCGLLNSCFHHV